MRLSMRIANTLVMEKPDIVNIDRGKYGKCNICLQKKKLTWEHVVPQAALFYDDLVLKSIHQQIHGKQIDYRPRISQNGLKLRTVCKECNSKLGRELDPALIDFLKTVKNFGESHRAFNPTISIRCQPNAIIRAVLGHLLASKYHLEFSEFDEIARKIIFDYEQPIPNNFNLFYWAYPYKNIAAYRDVIMLSQRGDFGAVSNFQILKCYPVSFLFTDTDKYENLLSLKSYNSESPEKVNHIPLNLFEKHAPNWPESIGVDNIFVIGQAGASSITGIQKKDLNT